MIRTMKAEIGEDHPIYILYGSHGLNTSLAILEDSDVFELLEAVGVSKVEQWITAIKDNGDTHGKELEG
jgi:hypothetical protein